MSPAKKRFKKSSTLLGIFILFLVIGVFIVKQCQQTPVIKPERLAPVSKESTGVSIPQDTLDSDRIDSTEIIDTIAPQDPQVPDSAVPAVSPVKKQPPTPPEKKQPPAPETTLLSVADSLRQVCIEDSVVLWVYPSPSGGRHYDALTVQFKANKDSVSFFYRQQGQGNFVAAESAVVAQSSTLEYFGVDRCGDTSLVRTEQYQIVVSDTTKCPPAMMHVQLPGTEFCIDTYEWPNVPGKLPTTYVSRYHAEDSCYAVGKRLCSAEEFTMACSGPYSWRYPYGDGYEQHSCNTTDTTLSAAGSFSECRSWFGVYDLVGNVGEWTSSRAKQNSLFFQVAGGFWESGSAAKCSYSRYSYFPQNKHHPVGFRCCKDVEARR